MKNVNIDAATLGKAFGIGAKLGAFAIGMGSTGLREGTNALLGTEFIQELDGDTVVGLAQGEGDAITYAKEKGLSIYKGEKSVTLTADEIKECNRLAKIEWEADKSGKNLHALRLQFKQAAKASKSTNQ